MTDPAQQGAADTSARQTVAPEPPFDPSERISTTHMRSLTPHGTERVIVRAPWYVTISAAVVDCVIGGGLLLLLNGGKLRSPWSEGIALAILGGIAGVRVADYVRAVVKGVAPTGAGPSLLLFALLSQVGPHAAAALRVLLMGAGMVVVVVGMNGCSGAPPIVFAPGAEIRSGREAFCAPSLDPLFDAIPPVVRKADAGVADASAGAPGDASSAAAGDGAD